jgi:hypothetical protein
MAPSEAAPMATAKADSPPTFGGIITWWRSTRSVCFVACHRNEVFADNFGA